MLQTKLLLCAAAAASTAAASAMPTSSAGRAPPSSPQAVLLRSLHRESPQEQRAALRSLICDHEAAVQRNHARRDTRSSTYDESSCTFFPFYRLACLPATMGGGPRESVRAALQAPGGAVEELRETLLKPWQASGERAVVVFGCKSTSYLRRQLVMDEAHTFLIVDHSLKALANTAAALVMDFGPRVHFLRADAMFAAVAVLQPTSVDTVVAPMPAPFWSERGSHRRLVTADFLCASHRALRARVDAADPRGVVAFTDSEPHADFMVEQLTEARLVVPWTRKNPREAYGRWLPLEAEGLEAAAQREFPQQRFADVVAVAASKSGPTSDQALRLVEGFDYKRRYYRTFNDGA